MVAIIFNILFCVIIIALFVNAMIHIPVREKIQYEMRRKLKKSSIWVFVAYLFTIMMLFFVLIGYGERYRYGMTLSLGEEFVCNYGIFVLSITYIPAFVCGISNIFIYGLRDKVKK